VDSVWDRAFPIGPRVSHRIYHSMVLVVGELKARDGVPTYSFAMAKRTSGIRQRTSVTLRLASSDAHTIV